MYFDHVTLLSYTGTNKQIKYDELLLFSSFYILTPVISSHLFVQQIRLRSEK